MAAPLTIPGSLAMQQFFLLRPVLGRVNCSGILGLLQINQLLAKGGRFGFPGAAATELKTQAAGEHSSIMAERAANREIRALFIIEYVFTSMRVYRIILFDSATKF